MLDVHTLKMSMRRSFLNFSIGVEFVDCVGCLVEPIRP